MKTAHGLVTYVTGHQVTVVTGVIAALLAALVLRKLLRGRAAEDLLTVLAALTAQVVVMNGMWRFTTEVLGFTGVERASMFAFLEIAVVACAFRARRNMKKFDTAGVEGIAVWVLSALSGFFAALAASSLAAALFRLAAPLVAAWLWHRAMALERRARTGLGGVHWRLSAERILVWLRLAEPAARSASEVDAQRRISRLARSAKRARAAVPGSRRRRLALYRLERALTAAVTHAGLAADEDRQGQMLAQIGTLNAAESLITLPAVAPWELASAGAPPAPRSAVVMLDDLARTITLAAERPDPGPQVPMPDGPWLPVPPDVDALLHGWARPAEPVPAPVHHEEPVPDDIEAEAARLFAESRTSPPAPAVPSTRTRRPAARPASTAKEWTPASVGRTEDEVIAMTRSLTRNQLAAQLPCSRGTADKLRAKYLQPATAGANGTR